MYFVTHFEIVILQSRLRVLLTDMHVLLNLNLNSAHAHFENQIRAITLQSLDCRLQKYCSDFRRTCNIAVHHVIPTHGVKIFFTYYIYVP